MSTSTRVLTVLASVMALVSLVVLMSTTTTDQTLPNATPASNLEAKRTEVTVESLELKLEDSMAPATNLGLKKFVKKTVKSVTSAVSTTTSAAGGLLQDTVECVAKSVSSVATEVCDAAEAQLNDLPGLVTEAGDSLADQTLNGLDKLKDIAETGWDQMMSLFNEIPVDVDCGYTTDFSASAVAELKCTITGIPELSPVVLLAEISTSDLNIMVTIEAAGQKVGPFALLSVACLKQPNNAGTNGGQVALCFTLENAVWKSSDGSMANPLSGDIGMVVKAVSGKVVAGKGVKATLFRDDKIAKYSIATTAGAASNPLPEGTDCAGGLLTCASGSSCQDRRRRRRQPWTCTADAPLEGQEGTDCAGGTLPCSSGTSCQDRRRRRRQPYVCTSLRI